MGEFSFKALLILVLAVVAFIAFKAGVFWKSHEKEAASTTEIVNDSQHSKVYNLVIPVGVNNMVFYAKAGTAASNPQSEGKTNFNVTTTKEASTFSLQQIYSTDFDAAFVPALTANPVPVSPGMAAAKASAPRAAFVVLLTLPVLTY